MRPRIATLCLGAALTLAATAAAQDTTRTRTSQQRIRVGKESPGEVVAPRVDTVQVFRTDTLRVFRTDTVTVTNNVTTMRVDTVTVAAVPVLPPRFGGFYIGLAGGSSFPGANNNDASKPGWRVEMPFGFDPKGSGVGLRFNVGFAKHDAHSFYNTAAPDPTIMNGDADLKLRLPGLNIWALRLETYAIGGGTYNRYKDMAEISRDVVYVGDSNAGSINAPPTNPDHGWHNTVGFNAGGGVALGWGNANLYLESRYSRFSNRAPVAHIPLVLGLMWY